MKTKRWLIISLIVIVALLMGGCARQADVEEAAEPPVVEAPVVEEEAYPVEEPVAVEDEAYPADEDVMDDEDERMQGLISEKIENCHMLNFILSQNKTREEWSVTIDRMIGKGADVNAEEKELIINWLVSRNE
jgi:hypothetical protein